MKELRYTLDKRKVRSRRALRGFSGYDMRDRIINKGKRPSTAIWYAWESGERSISHAVLQQVCKILRCRQKDVLSR